MEHLARLSAKRGRLAKRDLIQRTVRSFFHDRDFLEVSTPLIASSVIPEEHIDLLATETGFLLPSPEVHMKPLLAAGFERIFRSDPGTAGARKVHGTSRNSPFSSGTGQAPTTGILPRIARISWPASPKGFREVFS